MQKRLPKIIACNLKVVNYFDVTFNLNDGYYRPCRKPINAIHYIHIQSNHPESITKRLPWSIEKVLIKIIIIKIYISRNDIILRATSRQLWIQRKTNLQRAKGNYETAGKNQKRNILWFNPAYSKSLKTNIVKYFRLFNKHFPLRHNLRKIFNKNTLKLSFSCIPNLKAKIDEHNKKILENKPPLKKIIELKKENCPIRGACLIENVLYYAKLSCDDKYKETCQTTFKKY